MKYWRHPLDQDTIRTTKGKLVIIDERCKGCELCVFYCPRKVLAMSQSFNNKGYHYPEAVNETKCVNCRFCEAICPEFSIFSVPIE